MDALVMCGGHGTRLDADVEKPLFVVGGEPMVDRVLDALADSQVETIYAAVSPNAPATRAHLAADSNDPSRSCSADPIVVETPGQGYVPDLEGALQTTGTPVLTVAADLPLLSADLVDELLAVQARRGGSLTVAVPLERKRRLGTSIDRETVVDGLVPAGINVVADGEGTIYERDDARLAVNVNRRSDGALADDLLETV